MSPACLRGVMTADPDVIRRSSFNQKPGLNTLDPITGFPDLQFDRFASLHQHPRNSKLLVNSFVRTRRAILPSRPPAQHATERRRCQDRPSLGRRRLVFTVSSTVAFSMKTELIAFSYMTAPPGSRPITSAPCARDRFHQSS